MVEPRTGFTELRASLETICAHARELRIASRARRHHLSATRREIVEVLDRARVTHEAACQLIASLRTETVRQTAPEPSSAVLTALAILGRDESELEELADDLIAAFKAASAMGDEEGQRLLAVALKLIGRHLAMQVGPKAAGVVMN